MKVTPAALRRRVLYWQKVLATLGLSHWRVAAVEIKDDVDGKEGALAAVWPDGPYDTTHMQFRRDALPATLPDRDLDERIVHEWLHMAFRDYDKAAQSIRNHLSAATREEWEDRCDATCERLTENLARLIVALHG